jgi:UDPglucose 6-dehydrogenase
VRTAREAQVPLSVIESVVQVNDNRKGRMADKIIAACGGNVAGKTLAVLGLTFKPNTDDMRDSPSLSILPRLIAAGATIRAFDPEGMEEAKKLLPGLAYCTDAYETMEGADALVLLTEWNAFRALDLDRVRNLLGTSLVIDLRNIYQPQEMVAAGLSYVSIGRAAHNARSQLRALA